MKLRDHIEITGKTVKQAALELGYDVETVRVWMNESSMPRRQALKEIFEWSGGAVTANDFCNYPDLGDECDSQEVAA